MGKIHITFLSYDKEGGADSIPPIVAIVEKQLEAFLSGGAVERLVNATKIIHHPNGPESWADKNGTLWGDRVEREKIMTEALAQLEALLPKPAGESGG